MTRKDKIMSEKIFMSSDDEKAFVRAVKIGYYKEFYKKGLISSEQLEKLISLQNNAI